MPIIKNFAVLSSIMLNEPTNYILHNNMNTKSFVIPVYRLMLSSPSCWYGHKISYWPNFIFFFGPITKHLKSKKVFDIIENKMSEIHL